MKRFVTKLSKQTSVNNQMLFNFRTTSYLNKGERVGFIGLGQMGGRMVNHLTNDFDVQAFDINSDSVQKALDNGCKRSTDSLNVIASDNDIVVTMLPGPNHVKLVYEQLLSDPETVKGKLYIDASTIDPATSQEVAKKVEELGGNMIDAPVSGGVNGAAAGTLTFMVGGSDATFEASREVLEKMGSNLVHCGKNGMGQTAKICNNLVLGISMSAVSEAMLLGTKLGMDKNILAGIFNTSTARCWSSDTYNPCPGVMENVPSSNNYEGGFGSDLMLKDIGLALDAAESIGLTLPNGIKTHETYTELSKAGMGGKDFSAMFMYLDNLSKK
mmetsp:Transcript_209/g.363  ORF Transcript_209/g.363 Transcript_209/m.363 type:complete len:328 (-) Transcript_209:36-1019(-)